VNQNVDTSTLNPLLSTPPAGWAVLDRTSHVEQLVEVVSSGLIARLPFTRSLNLSDLHLIADLADRVEFYRQHLFDIFRTDAFQHAYQDLGRSIIAEHFDDRALLQVTPTARIQPAHGGTSVSFHTDGWYGHGSDVTSFWVPLVAVGGTNSLQMATDNDRSVATLRQVESERLDLPAINDAAAKICEPLDLTVGQIAAFASSMLHGTVVNDTPRTRVSFDFRIAAHEGALGTKPRANYRSLHELTAGESHQDASPVRRAIMYSGICRSITAKAQLVFLNEYARINNIDIAGSESEIVTMDYAPVLRNYCRADTGYSTVLAFSVDLLPDAEADRLDILRRAVDSGVELIFAAEDLSVRTEADIHAVETLRSS